MNMNASGFASNNSAMNGSHSRYVSRHGMGLGDESENGVLAYAPNPGDNGVKGIPRIAPYGDDTGVKAQEAFYRPAVEGFRSAVAVYDLGGGRKWLSLGKNPVPDSLQAFDGSSDEASGELTALLPPIYPELLGSRRFISAHGCRFPYVVGEMARGISTAKMVIAAGHSGLVGFFGSAGLRPEVIAEAIDEIRFGMPPGLPWGVNLIHSPDRPERERELTDFYLRQGVARISASAFMQLSPDIVRLSAAGLSLTDAGAIERRTHIFAKVSRPEVAEAFMAPPPLDMLRELAAANLITPMQAELQSRLPVAEDITIESDSGGHTDNRPLTVIYPVIDRLRRQLMEKHDYARPIRLGAAGGLGTPLSVATAFQLGADYVLTGSINQAAVESGLSHDGRALLAGCGIADVAMAPAADMFERGVKVQVLKKGTMFAGKAQRLYEIYRRHDGLDSLPRSDLRWLEAQVFGERHEAAWQKTRAYYDTSNPALAANAEADPKRQMALLFRRYLFMGAKWARDGHGERQIDYQIWCGPAMGDFNDWVRGTYLEPLENRTVGQLGLNLLEGACVALRAQQLRNSGMEIPDNLFHFTPRQLSLNADAKGRHHASM